MALSKKYQKESIHDITIYRKELRLYLLSSLTCLAVILVTSVAIVFGAYLSLAAAITGNWYSKK